MKTTKKALNTVLKQLTTGTAPKPVRIAAYALEGLPAAGIATMLASEHAD